MQLKCICEHKVSKDTDILFIRKFPLVEPILGKNYRFYTFKNFFKKSYILNDFLSSYWDKLRYIYINFKVQ